MISSVKFKREGKEALAGPLRLLTRVERGGSGPFWLRRRVLYGFLMSPRCLCNVYFERGLQRESSGQILKFNPLELSWDLEKGGPTRSVEAGHN